MQARFRLNKDTVLVLLMAGLLLIILVVLGRYRYVQQQTENPYIIGVILSTSELPTGQMPLLKDLINHKLAEINEMGGIDGRPVSVMYLEDQLNEKKLYELVKQTSQNQDLIAYVGCRGLPRSKAIAPLLTKKRIPLIGLYVFTDLLQKYPTMYTASIGIKEGRQVFYEILRSKARRLGFIGEKNSLTSKLFLKMATDLTAGNPEISITLNRTFPKGYRFSPIQDKQLADSLRKETDFVLLYSNPATCNSLLSFMHQEKLNIPVFIASPDLPLIDHETPGFQAADIYLINMFGIPGAQNSRWQEKIASFGYEEAESDKIISQLSVTGRIADEIGVICEAARIKAGGKKSTIRERINAGLKEYVNGGRIYRGWLTDWYFTEEHAYAGDALVAWKPQDRKKAVLAPIQYFKNDSGLHKRQVLYTNLNLESIDQVYEDDATFYATFFLEINSARNISLKNIDFINAARNEINHEALIESKLIRSKKDTLGYKFYNNLYKISGKFFFEPDMRDYPLDYQKFQISIQAKNPDDVFLVQPSQKDLRDTVFESEGWIYKSQYLGYEQDIISTVNNIFGIKKNMPYYKFSFVYTMKRAPIDFFLKTLVPLLTIVIITYFSVYIPPREFEALAAVQVTALLSSIALYFSTYRPAMQYATTSDKIFIFMYVMITTLIGTSIVLYALHHKNSALTRLMRIYQRVLFPFIVLGFTIYIRWF